MPILRLKDIRAMSSDDRRKRLLELRTELMRLRTMIKAGGSVENPGRIRELRKAIARILTSENEPSEFAEEPEEAKAQKKSKGSKKT